MSDRVALSGKTIVLPNGRIEPDEDGKRLLHKLQSMLMFVSSGRGGWFYFDPMDGTYWESLEFEDGQMTLRPVERSYIETNWPDVDLDRPPVEVNWPIRY